MLIKGKGRERRCLLLVLHSNSYYTQRRHWPAPEQQAHTYVLRSAEPCLHSAILLLPNLSGARQSDKRWSVGRFLFQTASDTTLMWCFNGNLCSPVCSRSSGQAVQLPWDCQRLQLLALKQWSHHALMKPQGEKAKQTADLLVHGSPL